MSNSDKLVHFTLVLSIFIQIYASSALYCRLEFTQSYKEKQKKIINKFQFPREKKIIFFVKTVEKYQIYVQKCSISPKNPIAVVKNSLNQVLLCVIFANFCASSWEKANGSLWPPPHLNGLLNYQWS